MGKMSRDKGKRYERELASQLRGYGFDARRSAQYAGNTGEAADVVGLPGIHIEAKHVETMRLYEWMAQAVHDAGSRERRPPRRLPPEERREDARHHAAGGLDSDLHGMGRRGVAQEGGQT